ncbi:Uncharacterised protein [Escherichia coli]|nr:Uncharacterised protein [Escherichia coli]
MVRKGCNSLVRAEKNINPHCMGWYGKLYGVIK